MSGPTGNGAVTRSTLRQQIADALRDEVLAGRMFPGQEFTVKEIAEQYGVSATPVREALVDLSAQGLLDAVQHRGFRVHEYSFNDYRGMIEARNLVADGIFSDLAHHGSLYGPVATDRPARADRADRTDRSDRTDGVEAATGPAGPAGPPEGDAAEKLPPLRVGAERSLLAVRRRGEEAERAARSGDLNVLIGYDLRFWRELNSLFGNPYLADFMHRLRVQCWACAVPLLRSAGDLKGRLWAGHTELVDALLRCDQGAARAVIAGCHAHALALVEGLAAG
jgi:DNA-binding GntR family transcriptional regulator